jgi:hypothetical protein
MVRPMLGLRQVLAVGVAVVAAATVAGCGQESSAGGSEPLASPPPAQGAPQSGPVSGVLAICGVQGVFWQGHWWIADPPRQPARNIGLDNTISGTMTTIGNNQARFDSPSLAASQILSEEPQVNANTPPFAMCSPGQS